MRNDPLSEGTKEGSALRGMRFIIQFFIRVTRNFAGEANLTVPRVSRILRALIYFERNRDFA